MKFKLATAASVVALTATATPVMAQDEASDVGSIMGDDIVVTARRVEEQIQNVPVAVTAIQGEALEKLGISQPTDLRTAVAGLNVTYAAGAPATALYMVRGMLLADQVFTQDPPVTIYLDEVLVTPVAGGNAGMFDLENVQVVKGPQGTLFGRNTTGGAVLYTSAKPKHEFAGKLQVGYGNHDSWKANGFINVPAGDGLAVRGAFDYRKQGGFGKVIQGPELGADVQGFEQYAGRLSVLAEPADGFSILTVASYSDYTDDGGPVSRIFDTPRPFGGADFVYNYAGFGTPDFRYTGRLDQAIAQQRADRPFDVRTSNLAGSEVKVLHMTNTMTVELSDTLTLKNIFGYRNLHWWEARDIDGTPLNILEASNAARVNTFSDELQLQGTAFDDKLDFIFGLYFFDQQGQEGTGLPYMDSRKQLVGTVAFDGPPRLQFNNVKNQSFSGFGQIGYHLTDDLTFNAGMRYTVDERTAVSTFGTAKVDPNTQHATVATCGILGDDGVPLGASYDECQLTAKASFAQPSWLVSLNWQADPNTLAYIAHRHSYRSGGFQSRAFDNDSALLAFKPESVNDLEIGLKKDWRLGADVGLRTNIAAYYTWYQDIQRSVTTATPLGVGNLVRNAAKAHIQGVELETELRLGTIARLNFNYAYTDPVYDSFPTVAPVNGVFVPIDRSDGRFQQVPKHQINGSISITPDVGPIGDLVLFANVYYQSTIAFSETYDSRESLAAVLPAGAVIPDDALYDNKPYALVNARAELNNISGSGFSIAVWGKNILDKQYIDTALVFQNAIGFSTVNWGSPATYGVDLTFEF